MDWNAITAVVPYDWLVGAAKTTFDYLTCQIAGQDLFIAFVFQ